MLVNLSDLSNEPLQSQISRQIRALILSGRLVAGAMLPSIRALSREQRISLITVQRAYENLEHEGLIHSRRGKGFFVSQMREDRKKAMARRRLLEDLGPLLIAASCEGMTEREITETFDAVLRGKAKKSRKRTQKQRRS